MHIGRRTEQLQASGGKRQGKSVGNANVSGRSITYCLNKICGVTDMRKSFNGLGGLVRDKIKKNLRSGDGFIFINQRGTMMKILLWDRSGFVIYYKRLEQGTFEMPAREEIDWSELVMIVEGIKLKSVRRKLCFAG